MTYIQGFVAAVPTANRNAYLDHARQALPMFKEFGAARMVEAWGDDVPKGKLTDFRRAALQEEGEGVVFSWVEWPSKQVRDAAWQKCSEDPRMQPEGGMPFDGKRMVYGGFEPLLDE